VVKDYSQLQWFSLLTRNSSLYILKYIHVYFIFTLLRIYKTHTRPLSENIYSVISLRTIFHQETLPEPLSTRYGRMYSRRVYTQMKSSALSFLVLYSRKLEEFSDSKYIYKRSTSLGIASW